MVTAYQQNILTSQKVRCYLCQTGNSDGLSQNNYVKLIRDLVRMETTGLACISSIEMNSTEQWLLATRSRLTPKVPDQRRSPARELSPMQSLQRTKSSKNLTAHCYILHVNKNQYAMQTIQFLHLEGPCRPKAHCWKKKYTLAQTQIVVCFRSHFGFLHRHRLNPQEFLHLPDWQWEIKGNLVDLDKK